MESVNKNEISAGEDLMREHGLLNRLLLIYEEIIARLQNNIKITPEVIHQTARLIKTFIEEYHEKTEETYVFPLLKQHGIETPLINELITQHKVGRTITDKIIDLTSNNEIKDKNELIYNMHEYIKMYRYHASREDTIIFPKFITLMTKEQYVEYGEKFEEDEHKHLGEKGFDGMLNIVVRIETYLGIYELDKITKEFENKQYYR